MDDAAAFTLSRSLTVKRAAFLKKVRHTALTEQRASDIASMVQQVRAAKSADFLHSFRAVTAV